jgi:hypothetical protein
MNIIYRIDQENDEISFLLVAILQSPSYQTKLATGRFSETGRFTAHCKNFSLKIHFNIIHPSTLMCPKKISLF